MKVTAQQNPATLLLADKLPLKHAKNADAPGQDTIHNTFATDNYHGAISNNSTVTYPRPLQMSEPSKQLDTVEKSIQSMLEASRELYMQGKMFKAADRMAAEYDDVLSEIKQSQPELADKNWGFSVDANGKLAVSGQLNQQETEFLSTLLNRNEKLVKYANEVKDNFLQYTAQERSSEAKGSGQYWGQYDITHNNFAGMIDFRSLLADSRNTDPLNKVMGTQLTADKFVDQMSDQLKHKAEVKYPL